MIQTVIRSLKLMREDQLEWADKITPVLMSYRATVFFVNRYKFVLCVVWKRDENANRRSFIARV